MSQTLVLSNSSLASAASGSGSSCRGFSGGTIQKEKEKEKDEKNTDKEREARSVALEKAYVHDVYEQISGIL